MWIINATRTCVTSDLGLGQMVRIPTRDDNTLVHIQAPLTPISAKSDHDSVLFDTAHQPVRAKSKRRTIYLWKKADTAGIIKSLTTYSEIFFNTSFSSVNSMCQDINLRQQLTKYP